MPAPVPPTGAAPDPHREQPAAAVPSPPAGSPAAGNVVPTFTTRPDNPMRNLVWVWFETDPWAEAVMERIAERMVSE